MDQTTGHGLDYWTDLCMKVWDVTGQVGDFWSSLQKYSMLWNVFPPLPPQQAQLVLQPTVSYLHKYNQQADKQCFNCMTFKEDGLSKTIGLQAKSHSSFQAQGHKAIVCRSIGSISQQQRLSRSRAQPEVQNRLLARGRGGLLRWEDVQACYTFEGMTRGPLPNLLHATPSYKGVVQSSEQRLLPQEGGLTVCLSKRS